MSARPRPPGPPGRRTGPPDDRALVECVLAGEKAAVAELYRRFRDPVDRALRQGLGVRDPDLRADLVSEVFTALLDDDGRRLRAWRARSTLRTYLLQVAANVARDRLRSRRYRRADGEPGEVLASSFDGPARRAEGAEISCVVWTAIEALSERDATVITLRFLRDKSPAEIAAELGCSANAASVAVHRALARLRAELARRAPDLFDPDRSSP